ncbi:kelch-like protein 5 [Episyrphus balteatus]|uniref:kelch-like protein 5 n=1 Tax=Episyrphus balteatus TaxID=286459 RepID=UPI00248511AC|nr:kelch-like protein 5 [Episyrphus balteatus]
MSTSSSNRSQSPSPQPAMEKTTFQDNKHATNISKNLFKLYEEKELLDVILKTGDIKIETHKFILSASSEYFFEMFRGTSATSKLNEVEINEIQGSFLKIIVNYMYTGSIELDLEIIEIILRAAVFLKMTNLLNGCCEFLEKNFNTDNCLNWLQLARELSADELKEKSLNFIYTNFNEVTEKSEFLILNEIELKDLLFKQNTNQNLEEQVFLSLVAWIEYDKDSRQHLLFELLSMIRYHYLTAKFIIENIKSVANVDNYQLILGWIRFHLSPESRTNEEQNLALTIEPRMEVISNQGVDTLACIHINDQLETELRCYDQTLNNWFIKKRSQFVCQKKKKHSMILINEKIFVVGGISNNDVENTVECLDLKTMKWIDLPPMRVARCYSQLAHLNGHLCVFGGFEKSDETGFIDSAEIFNISTRKWKNLHPIYKPKISNSIFGHKGILYIFDFHFGYLQCYNISSGEWTLREHPIDDEVRSFHVTVVNNVFYAIGEITYEYSRYTTYTVNRFDSSKTSWFKLALKPENSSAIIMATVIGNKITFRKSYGIVEYNLDTNDFTDVSSCSKANYFFPLKL